eukprot:TRINITY_DN3461_c0_g1_i1.p1 TRINITY_DN3461_c0_g1~~TRINITY_DN3461_c0_g1_i1.p1  ORF type:complete len:318 (+),score=44.11 TRINITY_DN3461_c0_g1_i1:28-981(+)
MESAHAHEHASHEGHAQLHQLELLMLISLLIVCQGLLYLWKRRSPASYQLATLIGLWLVPFLMSIHLGFLRMVLIWIGFSLLTALVLYRANQKPLHSKTPRTVYWWFHTIYRLSTFTGSLGYLCILADFFGLSVPFGIHHEVADAGLQLLFYGLYYGVLGRDFAEACASRMHSTMGYANKDGLPSKRVSVNHCSLCDGVLADAVIRHESSPGLSAASAGAAGQEATRQLNCGHNFHDFCVRGWVIVGKKDSCPSCSEKVDLRQTFNGPWMTQSLVWAYICDAVRYTLVWNPVLLTAASVILRYVEVTFGPSYSTHHH